MRGKLRQSQHPFPTAGSKKQTNELRELNISLHQSNEDLQQFAHVASHDLKEPVRKIKTYGNRLLEEYGDELPLPAKGD